MPSAHPSRRVVWITGAAGGLGLGLVAEFAAQSWHVAASYHRAAIPLQSDRVWPVPLDVTIRSQVQSACEHILARWGRIDVLINNAGINIDRLACSLSESDWDTVLAVNLKGAFLCAQAVLEPMRQQHAGQIIHIASFAARWGAAGQAGYAAAKAGLVGLTESLAKEVGSSNIRVNAVLPGVLPTPMTARLTADQLARLVSANALGRLNSVAEVARFIAFLAGLENVSGQLFQLDSRIARWT